MFDSTLFGAETHFGMFKRSVSSNVLAGDNPVAYDPSNPITLFIVQLVIIIVFTQGLGFAFGYIKQPKVIAEVIGGILLGPTAFGRIPGFTAKILPPASTPYLNLVAYIGLILFLFLVGLEVDVKVIKQNGRNSAIISAAGMIIPFGMGSAIAVPVYKNFVDSSQTSFGHFLLFVGVAMSITAFPVLCRILTSCKLLDTKVGYIVLAAGVGNDVVGWVLLALTLALVNSGSGVTAVYVLLCAVGWSLILFFPIKWGFRWLARRTGSIEQGTPTPAMMVITLLVVFVSAFVTDIIGVHPIFGGFIAGLIIPHEGGFAIALTEKIDDLVSMLFLPIYFVFTGLSCNLGLVNTGKDWGYTVLLCSVAWTGKFFGCAGAAKILGYPTRVSGAVGMLMSCKGLVELIVLNVGLQAGIIDERLYSMFVVEAVVLTFITTPITLLIYPERVRTRASAEMGIRKSRTTEESKITGLRFNVGPGGREKTSRFLVVLQKIEHLAAVMLLTQMLEPPPEKPRSPWSGALMKKSPSKDSRTTEGDVTDESMQSTPHAGQIALPDLPAAGQQSPASSTSGSFVQIDALKLIELTGRTFSVMQSAEKDDLLRTDDALQLFRQFGRLRGLEITPHINVVGQDSYPNAVADFAEGLGTELVIVPWTIPVIAGALNVIDLPLSLDEKDSAQSPSSPASPFENIFGVETTGSPMYSHFIRRVFTECPSDIALFVDRGFGSTAAFAPGSGQHIFLPFYGGPDDRLALRFVIQLCHHSNVTATIVRINKPYRDSDEGKGESSGRTDVSESMQVHQNALNSNQLTVGPSNTNYPETTNRLASETADDIAWSYYTAPSTNPPRPPSLDLALTRVATWTQDTASPLSYALATADSSVKALTTSSTPLWRPILIVTGRGRRGAAISHGNELTKLLAEKSQNPSIGAELRKTVGDSATAMILGGGHPSAASILIMEAAKR